MTLLKTAIKTLKLNSWRESIVILSKVLVRKVIVSIVTWSF